MGDGNNLERKYNPVSRRNFFRLMGLAAGGITLIGCEDPIITPTLLDNQKRAPEKPAPIEFTGKERMLWNKIKEDFKGSDISKDKELTSLMLKMDGLIVEAEKGNVGLIFHDSSEGRFIDINARTGYVFDSVGRIIFHIYQYPQPDFNARINIFHELSHAAIIYETYKLAREESFKIKKPIKDVFQQFFARNKAVEAARLNKLKFSWGDTTLPHGYYDDHELTMQAYTEMYTAKLPKGELEDYIKLADQYGLRKVKSDTKSAILNLYDKYKSVEAVGKSLEWRWYIERLRALEYIAYGKPKGYATLITVKDGEVFEFTKFIVGKQIFDTKHNPLESNEEIRNIQMIKSDRVFTK